MNQLKLKAQIPLNFSAGSGLIIWKNHFWAVTDNEEALYAMPLARINNPEACLFKKISLSKNLGPIDKPNKPDWESLGLLNNEILLMPSFSTDNRSRALNWSAQKYDWLDFAELSKGLRKVLQEPNIEGFAVQNSQLILMQRGNGRFCENGLVFVNETNWQVKDPKTIYQPWPMEPWTWTDLCFLDENLFLFSATHEESKSTYEDGTVLGSRIGLGDLRTKSVNWLFEMKNLKIEGIAWDSANQKVFAVTDPDNESQKSILLVFDGHLFN